MREAKLFEPEQRRYVEHNLYCTYCGNTNQWQIDMRLHYAVSVTNTGITLSPDEQKTKRIMHNIKQNIHQMLYRSYDREKPLFHCANCGNTMLEMHDQVLECCWSMACPGCFQCGDWLEKEVLVDLCTECIRNSEGHITDDECSYLCPHYDNGLGEVREHYNLTLDELKRTCGY